MKTISVLSLEYVLVPVGFTVDGVATNPTADQVEMAIVPEGTAPVTLDWKTATWETDSTTDPVTYSARVLVGPGGDITLTASTTYDAYVRITDNPERPVVLASTFHAH